jgi:hypothetical protein
MLSYEEIEELSKEYQEDLEKADSENNNEEEE